MEGFIRRVHVADMRHGSHTVPVYVTVKYEVAGKKVGTLSLVGVEGPKANGDAVGSCGQFQPSAEHINRAPFYDRLMEVWQRWHLNDMRAGCEHQRAEGWGSRMLEVVTYTLTNDAWALREQAKEKAVSAACHGVVAELSDEDRALLFAKGFTLHPLPGLERHYRVDKTERKLSGWVRPAEHPDGELMKACPVCGYQYGSAWLSEEVPEDVLTFLAGLPEANHFPDSWR